MDKNQYSKHQRDYTLLGTSVVFNAFCGEEMIDYFSHNIRPLYIMINRGILYHYISELDAVERASAWMKKYKETDLIEHKKSFDPILKEYKEYLGQEHLDIKEALYKLHYYFGKFLPLIMVGVEIPEHFNKKINKSTLDLCFKIREEYEFVHKVGFEVHKKLLNRLETEKGLEKDILTYLTLSEFDKFISDGVLPKDVNKRKDFVLVKVTNDNEEVSSDRNVLKGLGLIEDIDKTVKEIKGMTAYKGVVRGNVKIITLVSDASNLKSGDILVTSMTDPRYLPLMEKASAFVTDEGGVTCHAAIVAREMRKPCIIGTKIATQVLKDGDTVEVDADKGVVRIIK